MVASVLNVIYRPVYHVLWIYLFSGIPILSWIKENLIAQGCFAKVSIQVIDYAISKLWFVVSLELLCMTNMMLMSNCILQPSIDVDPQAFLPLPIIYLSVDPVYNTNLPWIILSPVKSLLYS